MEPTNPTSPSTPTVPAPVVASPTLTPQVDTQYARVRTRFLAAVIDAVILGIVSSIVGTLTALAGVSADTVNDVSAAKTFFAANMIINLLLNLLNMAYFVVFIGLKGQTPGKMLMKIKVVKQDTQEVPGLVSAFLREVVGKFISSIVLGIGYIVAIKDPKKQTWHDKIANTVVVKV